MPAVHTAGAAAPAAATRAWLPQPGAHCGGDIEDGISKTGTGDPGSALEQGTTTFATSETSQCHAGSPDHEKTGFKAARKVASRAGKVATKGANKMASALKKKLRHQSDTGEHQIAYGRMDGEAQLIGAAEHADVAIEEDDREERTDSGEQELPEEKGEGEGLEAATAGRSECEDRPQLGAHVQVRRQEQRAQKEFWDAAAFRNVRPLQCRSIWDIPTSRIPDPQPEPAEEDREAAYLAENKAKRRKLPIVPVSISGPKHVQRSGGGGRQCCTWRVKLCAVVAVSAVFGAILAAAT